MGDPYTYLSTNVLINLLDIRDAADLAHAEADLTALRLAELGQRALPGRFDRAHLCAIHRYVFQDIYAWAGKLRTVDIRKEDSFFFARPQFIARTLDVTFMALAHERFLKGLEIDAFTSRAAHYLGEINAIHPFREGNGRAQREFLRTLGQARGFSIDWSRAHPAAIVATSVASFAGDPAPLIDLLRTITVRRIPT